MRAAMNFANDFHRLVVFPGDPLPGNIELRAACRLLADDSLLFSYRLQADLSELCLPVGIEYPHIEQAIPRQEDLIEERVV